MPGPILTAMVGNFIRRENSFPFQAAPAKVEEQDHLATRVRNGQIIYALSYIVVRKRMEMSLVFDQ